MATTEIRRQPVSVVELAQPQNSWKLTPDRLAAHITRNDPVTVGFGGGFQIAGPYQRPRHVQIIGKRIAKAVSAGNGRLIINQPPQSGKLLALDTPIATPTGWSTMGALAVGDLVFDAGGCPTAVSAVSEIQYRPVHRLVFDDGSSIDAGPEHRWVTFDDLLRTSFNGRKRTRNLQTSYGDGWWDWKTTGLRGHPSRGVNLLTTAEILGSLTAQGGTKANHSIPTALPLCTPDVGLPLDPWLLGYWLGNGGRGSGGITCGSLRDDWDDDHVIGKITAAGWYLNIGQRSRGGTIVTVRRLIHTLRAMGIDRSKTVPAVYLRASARQRLELLRGLMDSDGTPTVVPGSMKRGSVEFSSNDEHLADTVEELAVSLGAKVHRAVKRATYRGVDYGPHYRVNFNPSFNPFSLPRKANLWAPGEETGRALNRLHRQIVAIETPGIEVAMRCIEVESPSHLYLAGRSMVPTHNSELVSHWTPTWAQYLKNGAARVLLGSYGAQFASTWGKKVRDTITEHGDELDLRIAKDASARNNWATTAGGQMLTAGVGGPMTGLPGDVILIDDPFKDFKDAHSPAVRDEVWDWFWSVPMTRVQPGTTVIVLHTRWHQEDLTGRLLDSPGGHEWDYIRVPALCDDPSTDILGRRIGESIWEDRFSAEYYENLRVQHGPYRFAGMYQQSPSPLDGEMFKRANWQRCDVAPAKLSLVRQWDLAGTEGAGDWTVGLLMGRADDGRVFILDVVRDRVDALGVENLLRSTAEADRDKYGGRVRIHLEQEPGSSGKTLAANYIRVVLAGHPAKAEPSTGDKILRALPFSAQQSAGNVSLVRQLRDGQYVQPAWWDELIEEMAIFPQGGHDDQVDAASLAFSKLVAMSMVKSKVTVARSTGTMQPAGPTGYQR